MVARHETTKYYPNREQHFNQRPSSVCLEAVPPAKETCSCLLREEFRQEPQNLRVAQGETALLECGPPRGHPEPTVIWKRNGHVIDFDSNKRMRLVDGANLAIQDVRQNDDGKYQCVAKNTVGIRESAVALLRVHVKPYIVKGPEDAVSLVGGSVAFECSVDGDPVPDVMWKRTAGGGPMPLARARILDDKSLRLEAITPEDEGEYSCEADNGVGTVSASAMLTVHSPPVIMVKPQDLVVEISDDAVFTCVIDGNPRPSIFWSVEGNRTLLYPGETMGRFHASLTPDGQAVLTVQDVTRNDSGIVVICSAVNQAGSDTWRARLSVTSPEENPPPVILIGPANQTLPLKSVAAMNCRGSGVPTPVILWYKDGAPLLGSPRINISETGSLQINDLIKDDSGEYTCVASSRSGKATWSANLRLESPTNPNIAFYRAPEASTLPGAPSRPSLVNRTHNSVTISWARNNKIGSSSLIGYQIEVFARAQPGDTSSPQQSTPGWATVARRVPGPTYTVNNLRPGSTYVFLVRAENSHGLSPPSPRSEQVTLTPPRDSGLDPDDDPDTKEARAALLSGHVVELAHIQPLSSTSMKIVWKILNGDYVEGFYIYSRGLDAPSRVTNMLTMLHDGEAPGFIVTGLAKFTRYQFFLVPFYKTLDGRPSNSRTARTLEDVPSESPTGLEAVLLNSSAVYLKWKAPPQAAHNGILRTYQVIVRGGDSLNGTLLSNVTVNAGTPSLLLTNLSSGVVYTVEVAAATRAGVGPFTNPATLRLDPASRQIYRDQHHRQPIGQKPGIGPGPNDFLTETWFMALLGSMVAVMLLLFTAMMLVRRRQLLTKKSSLPDSRSNGGILATPLSLKAAVGLPHPMSAALVPHPHDSTLWIEPGRGPVWAGEAQRIADLLEPADYAEVDPVSQGLGKSDGSVSPAPYATTTLVPKYSSSGSTASTRQLLHSSNSRIPQGWVQICPQKEKEDSPYAPQNSLYSSNVYSDTYFNDYSPPKGAANHSAKPSSVVMSQCGRKALSELGSRLDDNAFCSTLKRPGYYQQSAQQLQVQQQLQQQQHQHQQQSRSSSRPSNINGTSWRLTPNPVHTLSTFTPAPAHHMSYQPLYHNSSRSEPSS
ncbi:Roundabout, axon guidance receptor, homolog [Nesidiocoris tenuis]|uniref:Roundabout, axon guidance receptor, homolog n=1 Tax=Nesidiocoris tenuis TaxID=355587 RepID=A0ABN7AV58_9HEMI|nr:Roundabout, axon guidance receptor, homolog [Nesidiocoris tenuis]